MSSKIKYLLVALFYLFVSESSYADSTSKCMEPQNGIIDAVEVIKGITKEGYGSQCFYNNYFFIAFDSAFTATVVDCVNDPNCKLKEGVKIENVRELTYQKLQTLLDRPEMKRGSSAQVIGAVTYEMTKKFATQTQ